MLFKYLNVLVQVTKFQSCFQEKSKTVSLSDCLDRCIMKKNKFIKIGIILILLSGVAFAVMLIIPFLDIENKYKIIGSSASFIAMEVLFWVGGLLVGKELFTKYKSYLDPRNWFKTKDKEIPEN